VQNWTKLWNFISHDEFCNIHCIFVCRPTVYHSGECKFISRKPRETDTQIFTWLYLYYSAIRLWRNYVNIRKCWYTMYRYIGEVEINKKYMYFHSGIWKYVDIEKCQYKWIALYYEILNVMYSQFSWRSGLCLYLYKLFHIHAANNTYYYESVRPLTSSQSYHLADTFIALKVKLVSTKKDLLERNRLLLDAYKLRT